MSKKVTADDVVNDHEANAKAAREGKELHEHLARLAEAHAKKVAAPTLTASTGALQSGDEVKTITGKGPYVPSSNVKGVFEEDKPQGAPAQKPSVGQIVLYMPRAKELASLDGNHAAMADAHPLPAIITRVWSDTVVNLKVFTDADYDVWRRSVQFDADGSLDSGRWCWPPRV